ncbi:MAG TPA: tail fiber protein [Kofleriaceae bacterium]|nr:tail fiber protein [Kofleriaceae bacterium]
MPAPFPPPPPLPSSLASAQSVLPVGTVLAYAGNVSRQAVPLAMQGYLVCDGSALPVSQFYELFLVIGYQYSPSAGGGTFHLPDLQGHFLRGLDPAGTTDPDTQARKLPDGTTGPSVGSVQQSAFQLHEHEYTPAAPSGATTAGTSGTVGAGTTATSAVVQGSGSYPPLTSTRETRPVNTAVYYVIKYAHTVFSYHLAALGQVGGGG